MYIAYIDPGTGSMLISALIAGLSLVFFVIKENFYRLFSKGNKGDKFDSKKHYSLVYYSEGKQYYNVFSPLLHEGSKRGIEAIYLTSDKEDPALKEDLNHLKTIYIGTGKEAYFHLNRLNADILVMTTPGLDVLEIKRSKKVKHYIHITHATSSSGSYKSYGTDYYDSVLVGGQAELDLIRELEQKRHVKEKEIEIVGHTYLDVFRQKLKEENYTYSFFEERRPTILISPTWGNHGLLNVFGDKLLNKLETQDKYNLIIRPHPQSFVSDKEMIENLMAKYPNTNNRLWNMDRENLNALSHADLMISDFSGIIFDFFTLFQKPIMTMNAQFEKRGREAMDLSEDPWDIQLLDEIGRTINESDIDHITELIDDTIDNYQFDENKLEAIRDLMDKYPNEAAKRSMNFIETKQKYIKEFCPDPEKMKLFNLNNILHLSLSSLYLSIMTAVLSLSLPEKKSSQIFFNAIFKYAIVLSVGLIIILIISSFILKDEKLHLFNRKERFKKRNLFLVLLPMTPIFQYVLSNMDILELTDLVSIICLFLIIALMIIVLIPYLLSPIVPSNYLSAISTGLVFVLYNMANFGEKFRILYIATIFVLITLLVFITKIIHKQNLLSLVIVVFMMTNVFTSVLNVDDLLNTDYKNYIDHDMTEILKDKDLKHKPNIYLLVYDAYSNEETWKKLGYDNSRQMDYLLDNGFSIYDGTYSYGYASLASMMHVFNLKQTPYSLGRYRKLLAKEAPVLNNLKDNGYNMKFISNENYMIRKQETKFDETFPSKQKEVKSSKIIIESILQGEFDASVNFSHVTLDEYFKAKKEFLSPSYTTPTFIYNHDPSPGHAVLTGPWLTDQVSWVFDRLNRANETMKEDIAYITQADPNAIIVIAGDHGPYISKQGRSLSHININDIDKLDIQDRYGSFLAIKWPNTSLATKYDIQILQDLMPALFSYMYEDDSLFDALRMERTIIDSNIIGDINIIDGKIVGGPYNGQYLFDERTTRYR